MKPFIQLFIYLLFALAVSSQNYDDERAPYEFGFTIDGQQHRHEKKDQNGIIQGEFGFITADGIYHVTVYATDENGKFKILSMKNIRISAPLDGSPATGPISPEASKYLKNTNQVPSSNQLTSSNQPAPPAPPHVHQLGRQAASQPLQTVTREPFKRYEFTTQPTIKPACAGCGYVTTAKPIPGQPFGVINSVVLKSAAVPSNTLSNIRQQNSLEQVYSRLPNLQVHGGELIPPVGSISDIQNGEFPQSYRQSKLQHQPIGRGLSNQASFESEKDRQRKSQIFTQAGNGQLTAPLINSFGPNPLIQPEEVPKLPPISVSDNTIHVGGKNPKSIPIQQKYPGMVEGLPEGVQESDVKNILYKFKYTVGFHGHYEKGLKNGAKVGGYFVNGRDGISRVVTYVADENGYRPRFKFINLGLDSPDTPKADTEKTFGLKSFEFVWYPVD